MVVDHQEIPAPQKVCDFFLALAVRAIVALDKLHIQKRRLLRVEITVQDQLLIINAKEFLVVKIDTVSHVLVSWVKSGLGQISVKTKLFPCTSMRFDWESASEDGSVWVAAPSEMIELHMADGRVVKRLSIIVPASQGNRYVEAI